VERKKLADQPRWFFILEITAMCLVSVAAVRSGNAWLLFGTVPVLVFWTWGLVLKSIRAKGVRDLGEPR
jgi:hypothetical protein